MWIGQRWFRETNEENKGVSVSISRLEKLVSEPWPSVSKTQIPVKHVNSKPKIYVSYLTVSDYGHSEQSDSLNNKASKLFFLVHLQSLLVYLIFIWINDENENCVKTTVANQRLPFYRPTSKKYCVYNKYSIPLKGCRFQRCNFEKKSIHFYNQFIE